MKRGLSKQAIVDAALQVLDRVGIDGLTVRAVAAHLDVQAPALYWHVQDKQQLLDEMATEMWRRIGTQLDAVPVTEPWQQKMAAFASITRRTLLSIRDGAKVFSGTYMTDTGVLKGQEANLEQMVALGFTIDDVFTAWALLYSFTIGFCIEEQAVTQSLDQGDDRYTLETRNKRLDDGEHPLVIEGGAQIFGDQDARFDRMVAILVDAADRLRTHRV